MEHFAWDDSFSVDIESLDKQHKNIVRGINTLSESIKNGVKTKIFLFKLFKALKAYADLHFGFEEKLLEENKYSELYEHLLEYKEFVRKLNTLQHAFDSKEDAVMIELEMMDFLKDWLIGHIMMTDRKYTKFLQQKGVK